MTEPTPPYRCDGITYTVIMSSERKLDGDDQPEYVTRDDRAMRLLDVDLMRIRRGDRPTE